MTRQCRFVEKKKKQRLMVKVVDIDDDYDIIEVVC